MGTKEAYLYGIDDTKSVMEYSLLRSCGRGLSNVCVVDHNEARGRLRYRNAQLGWKGISSTAVLAVGNRSCNAIDVLVGVGSSEELCGCEGIQKEGMGREVVCCDGEREREFWVEIKGLLCPRTSSQ